MKTASQSSLLLPLLQSLRENGGRGQTKTLYEQVADSLGLPLEERSERIRLASGQVINSFQRNVRWAMQRAKALGLAERAGHCEWRLTGKGSDTLTEANAGLVVTVFVTPLGAGIWSNCEDGIALLDDGCIQAIISSPPYPLLRKKAYGNREANEYVDWFLRIAEGWARKLRPDGSVMLNLGDVWERGSPSMSLYQERLLLRLNEALGYKLIQRLVWVNPARLPSPAQWVNIERIRVKPNFETIYWLSQTDRPFADNRAVLTEYSASMRDRLEAGGERDATRPSGHAMRRGAFGKDNGGAIPGAVISASNTESNSDYIRQCKAHGLPVHPARFPSALPHFLVSLATRRGDLVVDPFGGSTQTGAECEKLGRRWLCFDRILEYLLGGWFRFA